MKTTVTVTETFHCSLERAFKTPILGDATKFLVGYAVVPPVVKFTEDTTWGKPGGQRIPHSAKTLFSEGGPVGLDEVYVREENKYWEWGIAKFYQPSFGFYEFRGSFLVEEKEAQSIDVKWTYRLFSNSFIAYPFHWFFTKVLWKGQMQIAVKNMKTYAESDAPFLFE